MGTKKFPHYAEPLAAKTFRVEKRCIVGTSFRLSVSAGGVGRVHPGERAEQESRIRHRSRHWPRRVLAVRDGDDASAAHQAERRLDADNSVHRRRTDDRAVRLRAHGRGAKVRGDGHP